MRPTYANTVLQCNVMLLLADNFAIAELPADRAEGDEVRLKCSAVFASGGKLNPSIELENNGHIVELNVTVNAGTVTGTALLTATAPAIGPLQCKINWFVANSADIDFAKNPLGLFQNMTAVQVICEFTTCITKFNNKIFTFALLLFV